MNKAQVLEAQRFLTERDGKKPIWDEILTHLGGGSREALNNIMKEIKLDEQTPTAVLLAFVEEAERLKAELKTLEASKDVQSLDDAATAFLKLERIEAKLPELRREADEYEAAQRVAHNRAVAGPRWKDAAQAKLAARGKMVLAVAALTEAFDVYAKAHLEQSYLLSTLPIPAPERAVYGGLLSQLGSALQAAVNYDAQGGQRSWGMGALRTFDNIGCRPDLPDGTIYG